MQELSAIDIATHMERTNILLGSLEKRLDGVVHDMQNVTGALPKVATTQQVKDALAEHQTTCPIVTQKQQSRVRLPSTVLEWSQLVVTAAAIFVLLYGGFTWLGHVDAVAATPSMSNKPQTQPDTQALVQQLQALTDQLAKGNRFSPNRDDRSLGQPATAPTQNRL